MFWSCSPSIRICSSARSDVTVGDGGQQNREMKMAADVGPLAEDLEQRVFAVVDE